MEAIFIGIGGFLASFGISNMVFSVLSVTPTHFSPFWHKQYPLSSSAARGQNPWQNLQTKVPDSTLLQRCVWYATLFQSSFNVRVPSVGQFSSMFLVDIILKKIHAGTVVELYLQRNNALTAYEILYKHEEIKIKE